MVDFAKLLIESRRIREECIFVGYCPICDFSSKLYEENIVKLATEPEHDLFKCPRCNVCRERDDIIPF